MWNVINKINAFLCPVCYVFLFYGYGFEDGSGDVRLSARLQLGFICGSFHWIPPPHPQTPYVSCDSVYHSVTHTHTHIVLPLCSFIPTWLIHTVHTHNEILWKHFQRCVCRRTTKTAACFHCRPALTAFVPGLCYRDQMETLEIYSWGVFILV